MMALDVEDDPLPYEPGGGVAPPHVAPRMAPHPQAGSTKRLAVDDTPLRAAIPFRPVSPLGATVIGQLTLQQIAALEVEIAHGFGRIPDVLAAFSLDRERYLMLKEELHQRLQDPEVKRTYEQEREAYIRWRGQQATT